MTEKPVHLRVFLGVAIAAFLLFLPENARAVTDEEIFRDFRFNLTSAGPRALGMGGAFVSVADDATAAQANPAGLTYVLAPEFFAEYRLVRTDDVVFRSQSGSLEVDPRTGDRNLPFLGVTAASKTEDESDPTFVSVVWPLRLGTAGRRLTLAGSRQVVLSQERSLATADAATESRFAFDSFPNTVRDGRVEAYSVETPVTGRSSAEIVYWNAGAALEVHQDFSFGVTVTYATLDVHAVTQTRVVDPLELFLDPGHPRLPGQPTTDVFQTRIDGTDSCVTYTLGVHWHPDSVFAGRASPWRFGAVFHRGARFTIPEATFLNDAPDETFDNDIAVPDRFGVGVSYRVSPAWLVAAELERIEYSDLLRGFRSGVNVLTSQRITEGAFGIDPEGSIEFRIDDGYLPRVGVEYVRPIGSASDRRISARAGYFRTPDDRVRLERFNSDDPDVNAVFLDAFRAGEAEDHFTAGFGYSLGGSAIQVAVDFGDRGSQIVGSYTFAIERRRAGGGSTPSH